MPYMTLMTSYFPYSYGRQCKQGLPGNCKIHMRSVRLWGCQTCWKAETL